MTDKRAARFVKLHCAALVVSLPPLDKLSVTLRQLLPLKLIRDIENRYFSSYPPPPCFFASKNLIKPDFSFPRFFPSPLPVSHYDTFGGGGLPNGYYIVTSSSLSRRLGINFLAATKCKLLSSEILSSSTWNFFPFTRSHFALRRIICTHLREIENINSLSRNKKICRTYQVVRQIFKSVSSRITVDVARIILSTK